MTPSSILQEGRNCWRRTRAHRLGVLIDAAAYYEAFREAAKRAEHQLLVVGWDVNSRTRLMAHDPQDGYPLALGEFLDALARRRPGLHVYVLAWDFAMIYAFEREPMPIYTLGWRTHRRLHFRLDDTHPAGASHHQKLVIIDDALAFCGGMDLAAWRWDTPEHAADDPRRVDLGGRPYPPVHDTQLAVDGPAASALGALARERWRRASGETPAPPAPTRNVPWPPGVAVRARDATVGIARTEPAHGARPEVREVERAYLDGIAAARRTLYIENQYLTAHVIVEALAARLAEPQGPEVVIVLPRACPGWLEETTMGVLRARVLRRLRDADRHRRLRVYAPIAPGLHGTSLAVHSKLLVADDALLRIGSANTSNRSMGFDTECDLWVEAGEGTEVAGAIARLRAELLGEHLGVPPGAVVEAQRRTGSLIAAVESLRGGARSLEPLAGEVPESLDRLIPDSALIDPERPMDPERLVEQLVPKDLRAPADHSVRRLVLALLALLGLAAAWRWTPLQAWAQPQTLAAWAESVAAHPLAPLLVVGAFTAGSFMMLPVTVMIVVTALAFGPVVGFGYALAGSLVAALANYGVGRLLGRTAVRRLGGSVIHRLSRRLARRGLLAIMTVRVLPVAPFTVINIAAGASHIRLRDFTLGTAVGMIPGILAMTVFTRQLANALQHPSLTSFAAVAIVVALLVLGAAWLRRRLGTNHRGGATAGGGGGG